MKSLHTVFTFHPIGQGCFYTGCIGHQMEDGIVPFHFVYDCGTNSSFHYLEEKIESYKQRINNELDLLILSHFDADHVNGVFKLLDGLHCKRLVIPYYEMEERLLLLIQSNNESADYISMLQSPLAFFQNYNIDEIVLIGGPGNTNNDNDNYIPTPPDGGGLESIKDITKIDVNTSCYNTTEKTESIVRAIEKLEEIDIDNAKVRTLNKKNQLLYTLWEFCFYTKEHGNKLLMYKFKKDVDDMLAAYSITLKEIFDANYLPEIKKLYKKHYKGFNDTSIVVYHGPTFNTNKGFIYLRRLPFWKRQSSIFGSILTGDINISTNIDSNKLVTHFRNYLSRILVFQVPHHGAKANWPFGNIRIFNSFMFYVVNHGLGRKKHPSPKVIDDIKLRNPTARVILNNQTQEFSYHFYFHS